MTLVDLSAIQEPAFFISVLLYLTLSYLSKNMLCF